MGGVKAQAHASEKPGQSSSTGWIPFCAGASGHCPNTEEASGIVILPRGLRNVASRNITDAEVATPWPLAYVEARKVTTTQHTWTCRAPRG